MYHSITFGDKNTWDDWHLVPNSRPLFLPPEQKVQTIDIPGGDGVIDLSESLTRYPIYNNRKGSIDFHVIVDDGYGSWATRYSEIMDYLHGRIRKAILEDDPEFYYEGRFTVSKWDSKNDGTGSIITIGYDVGPYKKRLNSSIDDWLWDPFNFETGIIEQTVFSDIIIDSDEWVESDFTKYVGRMPIVPSFIVTLDSGDSMDMELYCPDFNMLWRGKPLKAGTNKFYDIYMAKLNEDSEIKIRFKGHGKVSIDFRSGGL